MNNIWTKKWKSILIWISAYLNIIAYALVGGYVIVKNEDKDLQKTAKTAFIVTLIFTAFSAFLLLFNNVAGFSDHYYGSSAYEFYSVFASLVSIAKIVVFAVFVIMELVKKENQQSDDSQSNNN